MSISGIALGLFLIGASAIIIFELCKEGSKIEEKQEVSTYIDYDAEKIKTVFENLISEEFEIYSKLNPSLFTPGDSYLKADDITTTTSIIASRVFKRITPALRNNLKFIYNFKNDEDLINIIGEKVGLHVIGLAATVNGSMEESYDLSKK